MKETVKKRVHTRARARDERVGAMRACVRDTGPCGQPRKDTRILTVLMTGGGGECWGVRWRTRVTTARHEGYNEIRENGQRNTTPRNVDGVTLYADPQTNLIMFASLAPNDDDDDEKKKKIKINEIIIIITGMNKMCVCLCALHEAKREGLQGGDPIELGSLCERQRNIHTTSRT